MPMEVSFPTTTTIFRITKFVLFLLREKMLCPKDAWLCPRCEDLVSSVHCQGVLTLGSMQRVPDQ
jgi:hypothetical protein